MRNLIFKLFLFVLVSMMGMETSAYDFTQSGLCYNITSSSDRTVAVAGQTQNHTTLVIPSEVTYNGVTYSVTSIANKAFIGCYDMEEVSMPEGIISIGDYAFANNPISDVKIPASVQSIGKQAFGGRWDDCPDGEYYCWAYSPNKYTVDENNQYYSSYYGILYNKNRTKLIDVPYGYNQDIHFPSTLKEIPSDAFSERGRLNGKNLYIWDLSKFCQINITGTPYSSDWGDIYGGSVYSKIDKIYVYTKHYYSDGTSYNQYDLMYGTLTVPSNVTKIGRGTFYGCRQLSKVVFPANGVTEIGDYAFGATKLTEVTLPASIQSIGSKAFYDNWTETIDTGETDYDNDPIYEYKTWNMAMSSLVIPQSVQSIGSNAFNLSSGATVTSKITSPTNISSDAFKNASNCTLAVAQGLQSAYSQKTGWNAFGTIEEDEALCPYMDGEVFTATISDGIEMTFKVLSAANKTAQVGNGNNPAIDQSFDGDLCLPLYINGLNVTDIGSRAFADCRLKKIVLPNSITSINNSMRSGAVEHFHVPGSVTWIGRYAINECDTVVIEDGSTGLGLEDRNADDGYWDGTFSGVKNLYVGRNTDCSGYSYAGQVFTGLNSIYTQLTDITFGPLVTSAFKGYDFRYCEKVVNVTCLAKEPFSSPDFYSIPRTAVLNVPLGSKQYYESATGWSRFENIKEVTEVTISLNDTEMVYASDYDLDFSQVDGLQVYVAGDYDADASTITFTPVQIVSAGKGVILKGAKGTYTVPCANIEPTLAGPLCGTISGRFIRNTQDENANYYFDKVEHVFKPVDPVYGYQLLRNEAFLSLPTSSISSHGGILPQYINNQNEQNFEIIAFADANVKSICVSNWDTNEDGELSEAEAAAVTSLGKVFKENKDITSFDELQYFTGLTSIGNSAFSWCSGLTSVTIPNSLTSISNGAFYNCSGLTSVISKIEEPFTLNSAAFEGIASTCTLTVPDGTRDAYIAKGWTESIFKGGVVEASAPAPIVTDLTAEMYHKWTGPEGDATVADPDNHGGSVNLNAATDCPYGDTSVLTDQYADLSNWDFLTLAVTSGTPRLFFNSQDDANRIVVYTNDSKYVKSNQNGVIIYDLAAIKADAGYVHLNAIKALTYDTEVIVAEMKLATSVAYEPEDPVLRFADLTTDMFYKWTLEEPVEIVTEATPGCAFNLFKSEGNIYGDPSVNPDQFADLSEWDYLTIAVTKGTPRLLFNRICNPDAEVGSEEWKGSQRLEINSAESKYVESAENGLWIYDLKAIRNDSEGMVRLHAIKGADGNVTVHALKLSTVSPVGYTWDNIYFADANVKALCVENWDTDGDGELSKDEAAAVTDLGEVFKENEDITSFDELQYFTGLTSIGNSTFSGCINMTSVTIPEGVTSIGTDAFCHTGLENFTVPGTVKTVDWGAFTWNSSLKRIVFEEGVESVGNIQFYGCSNLEEVVFPSTLTGGQMLDMFNYGGANKLTHIVMPINWPLSRHAELFSGSDLNHSILFTIPAGSAKNYLQKGYYNISDNSELVWMKEEFEEETTRVEALKTVESITASVEAQEALQTAITTARSAVQQAESYLAIGAQMAAVKSAAKTFLATSTITAETDVTSIIRNPQFDRVDMGWNVAEGTAYQGCSVGYQNDGNYNEHTNGEVTIHDFLEAWWNDVPLGDGSITQTIANLPAGRYRLECDAIASWKADAGVEVTGVNLFAGAKKTPIATEDEKPQHFTVDFTQYRTVDCTIGIDISNTTANWVAMDNVRLYCLSDISSPVDENIAYYLQNVETGKYLNQGNDWGTHAVLADEGLPVKVTRQDDGSYTFYFLEGSTNEHLLFCFDDSDEEVYVDYNSEYDRQNPYWIISDAETAGTYRIQSISNSESMYLGNNPTKEAYDYYGNALGVYNDVDANILDTEGMNITWRFVEVEKEEPEGNYLALENTEAYIGRTFVWPIEMVNTESIRALAFEVILPTGVTLSKCELTDRKGDDHQPSFQKWDNGNYQVIVFSGSNAVFSGTEGTVLNMTLREDNNLTTGDYPISLTNIELTTATNKIINPTDVNATLTLMVSNVKIGDTNGDGKVSITDAVMVVSYILGESIDNFVADAADVDENGKITITDAVAIVDMILSGTASAKERVDVEEKVLDPQ